MQKERSDSRLDYRLTDFFFLVRISRWVLPQSRTEITELKATIEALKTGKNAAVVEETRSVSGANATMVNAASRGDENVKNGYKPEDQTVIVSSYIIPPLTTHAHTKNIEKDYSPPGEASEVLGTNVPR